MRNANIVATWVATCAAVTLSLTVASAQTTRTSAQATTLSGCVVREAANGGQATIASKGISYKLTGRTDKEFERYLGKRVEVTGTLDTGSTAARATTGKTGDARAPKGQTALAGQSDVPVTSAPRDNTTPGVQDATRPDAIPLATDKGTTADFTGRMQVKTIRILSPSCL